MDNFDKKLKKIAQNEKWEIPVDIDSNINNLLENIDKQKTVSKKPLKVALIVATITTLTLTTAFAVEHLIDYFKINKNSMYVSTQEELSNLSNPINLSSKDKNIEFIIDSVSADDNYINIFYTIKANKNIKEMDEWYEDPYFAMPFMKIYVDDKEIYETTMIEGEATYSSEKELKAVRRLNISHEDIKNKFNLKICIDKIFNQNGDWSISTNIDKTKAVKATKTYNVNKSAKIKKTYTDEVSKTVVNHDINIDKVIMSPLASHIVVSEKVKAIGDWCPSINYNFALIDQDGDYLDVIDKGYFSPDKGGTQTTSFEFIKGNKNITSLKYVPINYNENIQNTRIGAKPINKLPMEFKVNEYGKWVIEDIKFTDNEMIVTAHKEGFVKGELYQSLIICDENGEFLDYDNELSPNSSGSIDRDTKKQTCKITFRNKYKNELSKIKKLDMYTDSNIELLSDQAVQIDLKK